MTTNTIFPGNRRAVEILHEERRRVKQLRTSSTSPVAFLREALAIATGIAARNSLCRQWANAFALACKMRGVRSTRRDGLPVLRILRFLKLYAAASSARRHALAVSLLVRSGRSVKKLMQRMKEDGPKTIIEMARPEVISELRLTSPKPSATAPRLSRIKRRR